MSTTGTLTFNGFNAILGYIGGQAATETIFERLLWPQRHFSAIPLSSWPRLILLYSMGSPITSVALDAIDSVYQNGLFKGALQGQMLGTCFFPDLDLTRISAPGANDSPRRETAVRNCVWVSSLLNLPLPKLSSQENLEQRHKNDPEAHFAGSSSTPGEKSSANLSKTDLKDGKKATERIVRSRMAVYKLVLTSASSEDLEDQSIPFVLEPTDASATLTVVLATLLSESVGIVIMICTAILCRTLWSIMFVVPVVLRLLSAVFAIPREGTTEVGLTSPLRQEAHQSWEIICPPMSGKMMIISGPPSVVDQFFRHYGHPVRQRFFESIQLISIIALGCFFPVTLLCQASWMPQTIQYIWVGWQVWNVFAMHFDRYTQNGVHRSSTDANIGRYLSRNQEVLRMEEKWSVCNDTAVLLGTETRKRSKRHPGKVVKGVLSTYVTDGVKESKELMKSLLSS